MRQPLTLVVRATQFDNADRYLAIRKNPKSMTFRIEKDKDHL